MTFISVTRLRIRALRFLPGFIVHAVATNAQVKRADGFIAGSLLPDRRLTFWTMTLWHNHADMRRYMASGAHLRAMPKLMTWCDEASIVHWEQPEDDLPDWLDADRRMRMEGRPSKVLDPSADHGSMTYAPPRTARAVPIRPTKPGS